MGWECQLGMSRFGLGLILQIPFEGSCLWREKTNVKGIEIGLNEIGIRVEYHSRKISKIILAEHERLRKCF